MTKALSAAEQLDLLGGVLAASPHQPRFRVVGLTVPGSEPSPEREARLRLLLRQYVGAVYTERPARSKANQLEAQAKAIREAAVVPLERLLEAEQLEEEEGAFRRRAERARLRMERITKEILGLCG